MSRKWGHTVGATRSQENTYLFMSANRVLLAQEKQIVQIFCNILCLIIPQNINVCRFHVSLHMKILVSFGQ